MVVFDDDFHVGKIFLDRGFQIAKSDGLQPHLGVIKVPDRWLNEEDFHAVSSSYSVSTIQREVPRRGSVYGLAAFGGECVVGCAMHPVRIEEWRCENRTN